MKQNPVFGELLKKYMAKRKISGRKLAIKSGVAVGYISEIVNGKRENPPSPKIINKISQALELAQTEKETLLEAANFSFEEEIFSENSTIQKIWDILSDSAIPYEIKSLVQEDITRIVASWSAYVQAQQSYTRNEWEQVIAICDSATELVEPTFVKLPSYLLDIKAVAHLHLGNINEAEKALNRLEIFLSQMDNPLLKRTVLTHQRDVLRLSSKAQSVSEPERRDTDDARADHPHTDWGACLVHAPIDSDDKSRR